MDLRKELNYNKKNVFFIEILTVNFKLEKWKILSLNRTHHSIGPLSPSSYLRSVFVKQTINVNKTYIEI